MKSTRIALLVACSAGLLLVNACLANLERTLDLVLAPGAIDNALVLPYTRFSGLAQLLAGLFST